MNFKETTRASSWMKGEVMRNAQRLLEAKGEGALVHAQHMVKKMQETGDEKELAFWERIAAQVELLLHELPPE